MSQLQDLGPIGGSASGDVVGPSSSTDNAIVRFDGTTGKLIQNSTVLISDGGDITGAASITLSDLTSNRMVMSGASGLLETPSALTNGQLYIGSTGAQPAAASLTSTGGSIVFTAGAGTLNLETAGHAAGTGSTVGALTADIITLNLGAVASSYSLVFNVGSFESSGPSGGSYRVQAAVRTDGASASLIGSVDVFTISDAAISTAIVTVIVSANTAILRVTGVAALTINWTARLNQVQVT